MSQVKNENDIDEWSFEVKKRERVRKLIQRTWIDILNRKKHKREDILGRREKTEKGTDTRKR